MRIAPLMLLLLFTTTTLVFSQDEPAEFQLTADQKVLLTQKLDRQWTRLFEPELKKGSSLIEVAAFSLNASAVNYRPERLEAALNILKKNINRSNKNPETYGNIFWYYGDTEVKDSNAVEFCLRQTLPIWILYRDKLSSQAEDSLREIFDLGIEGIKRHKVNLSYTNIILMKIANLIILGEYYDQPELAQTGYGLFKDWIIYTYRNGLCEYLSPTYYTIDIQNLALIYRFTKDSGIRKMAETALEYIWTDIALNWYEPSQRLGGTHSRDYDRLYGHNILDQLVAHNGWSDLTEEKQSFTSVLDLLSLIKPATQVKDFPLPRFIYQRWGEAEYQRASNYIGFNFSVASAESNYNNMDKTPLVINLGGGYWTPVINFFMDGREDYYGFRKIPLSSGHLKSLHLKPFITSIQNDSEVLFLASIKDNTDSGAKVLESVITLPSDSEIWLNHQKLDIFHFQSSWQVYPDANNDTTRFMIVSLEDRPTVRLIDKDRSEGIGIRRKFKVTPQKYYRLKASVKGHGISVYINFFDQNHNLIGKEHYKSIRLNSDQFTWNEIMEQAPEKASYCYAWIYSPKSSHTDIAINDLIFEELNGQQSPEILGKFDFEEEIRQQFIIPEQACLFIKREDTVATIRLLKALDVSGRTVSFNLYNDRLKYEALRLTATHSRARTGKRGTIVIWSYTTEGIKDDQAFEDLRKKVIAVKNNVEIAQDIFNIKVSGITREMELRADVEAEIRILRRGMKPGLNNGLISVNGNEVGGKILERLALIKELRE